VSRAARRGPRAVALPGAGRPEGALNYHAAKLANSEISGLAVVAGDRDDEREVRVVGSIGRRDVVYGAERLKHLVLNEGG